MYCTGNRSPTSSEVQSHDQLLSLNTHATILHVSAAIFDASAHHVLLGVFNIQHPI